MRASRPLSTLVIFAAALGLCLSLATAALAADGVRVIPSPVATPDPGQLEPAISGDYLAYTSTNPVAALSDQSSIALKYLGDAGRPTIIPTPDFAPVGTPDYKDMQPSIAVDGSKIYVVWTRIRLSEPWDTHIWIWKGEYRMPLAGGFPAFIADDGYPRVLVEGPDQYPLPSQDSPSIGLASRNGEQHVIVAWEDSRNTSRDVPEVYWHDLTEAPDAPAPDIGMPVDSTGVLGRGQHLPTVGADAVFWLDERFTWWDFGQLMDTAVYRMDLGSQAADFYFRDTNHAYDNGMEEPVADHVERRSLAAPRSLRRRRRPARTSSRPDPAATPSGRSSGRSA